MTIPFFLEEKVKSGLLNPILPKCFFFYHKMLRFPISLILLVFFNWSNSDSSNKHKTENITVTIYVPLPNLTNLSVHSFITWHLCKNSSTLLADGTVRKVGIRTGVNFRLRPQFTDQKNTQTWNVILHYSWWLVVFEGPVLNYIRTIRAYLLSWS